jgi:N-6 DNA Methylase
MRDKNTESALLEEAAKQLRAVGFMVGTEVPLPSFERHRADIVGWLPDDSGKLRTAVVVEVKVSTSRKLLDALSQLATFANGFGAARAYVFDGSWHLADDTFTSLKAVPAPLPESSEDLRSAGEVRTQEVLARAFRELDQKLLSQGSHLTPEIMIRTVEAAQDVASTSGVSLLDAMVRQLPGDVLLGELRSAIESRVDARRGEQTTPKALADALGQLASPFIAAEAEDPFCGFGNCLWSLHAAATAVGRQLRLRGSDTNALNIQASRALARIGGVSVDIEHEDFFAVDRPTSPLVVTNPPIGTRAPAAVHLSGGEKTTDRDVIILDRLVDRLPDKGHLVQVVPLKVLFADGVAQKLRERISSTVRVIAVIELPPKVFMGSTIPCAVVVIGKTAAGQTLIARLGDDWSTQLAPEGAFFRDYRRHIESSQ